MLELNKQIKAFFLFLSAFLYRNPWTAITVMLLLAIGLASQLPKIKIDTATESFFHENDPDLRKYTEFQEQFGQDDLILIALNPLEIFSLEFLNKLKALHNDIEKTVPNISDITSMINSRSTRGEGDELIVEDLLEKWPENESDLAVLKERVMSNPVYKNTLISENGKFTAITIEPSIFSIKTPGGGTLTQSLEEDPLAGFEDDIGLLTPEAETSQTGSQNMEYLTDAEKEEIVKTLISVISKYKKTGFPHLPGRFSRNGY